MKIKSRTTRKVLLGTLVALILSVTWLHGVFVGKREAFPYRYLVLTKNLVMHRGGAGSDGVQFVRSALVPLLKSTHDSPGPTKLVGWGGGLAAAGSEIVGVDREGHFFRYVRKGHFQSLPITIETNEDEYWRYYASVQPDSTQRSKIDPRFRVLDLEAKEEEGRVVLFVSYNYWHVEELGKTVRVARLVLDGGIESLRDASPAGGDDWEVIFETKPLIPFSLVVRSPFNSDRSGGRMVVDGDNGLFVTVGDHLYDGVRYPSAPRDTTNSYGKVIRIDLESLRSEIFSTGHRNPQGLLIDRDGNIWETEHGPQGGDELNLLRQGIDYGWPSVSYGTDYGTYLWPLNPTQGRHDGYVRPIFSWVPAIATSNLIQINGVPSQWDGDLLVSSLRATSLFRVRVEEGRVLLVEPVLIGERIRDLVQMRDGTILLWTDTPHLVELKVDSEAVAAAVEFPVELTPSEIEAGLDPVIRQCWACHGLSPSSPNNAAISLWGVYGRDVASTPYPAYSHALKERGGKWTARDLESFLSSPSAYAPGSFMPDPAISDQATLKALVGYLERLQ